MKPSATQKKLQRSAEFIGMVAQKLGQDGRKATKEQREQIRKIDRRRRNQALLKGGAK